MATTETAPEAVAAAYKVEREKVRGMILNQHRIPAGDPDGEVDRHGLVAHAIRARREVERLEAIVNRGNVPQELRDELTQAQWWDMHLQATLRREIPQWSGAIANARTGFSKTMTKAARSLGLAD